jgi:hypothetical protein
LQIIYLESAMWCGSSMTPCTMCLEREIKFN